MPGHFRGTDESDAFLDNEYLHDQRHSSEEGTVVDERQPSVDPTELHNRLAIE